MPKYVISSLNRNAIGVVTGGNTTEVADEIDLAKKADKISVDNKVYAITRKIETETQNRQVSDSAIESKITSIKSDLDLKAEKIVVKDILSATHLDKVKSDISGLYKQHVALIQEETRKSHDKNQSDIIEFGKVAEEANKEIEKKFIPIENSIKSFNEKIDNLTKCINRIEDVDAKTSDISDRIKKVQEETTQIIKDINNQIAKAQEEANNVSKKMTVDLESKISSVNEQLLQAQSQVDMIIGSLESLRNDMKNMIIGSLESLRNDMKNMISVECGRIDNLVTAKFNALQKQLLTQIEENKKVKRGFWSKLFHIQ